MEIDPLLSFLLAFVATMAFAILFQAPRSTLPCSGFVGALGWVIFIIMAKKLGHSTPVANFCATVLLAAAGEISARLFKQPSTVYIIPGIIPLVPGWDVSGHGEIDRQKLRSRHEQFIGSSFRLHRHRFGLDDGDQHLQDI